MHVASWLNSVMFMDQKMSVDQSPQTDTSTVHTRYRLLYSSWMYSSRSCTQWNRLMNWTTSDRQEEKQTDRQTDIAVFYNPFERHVAQINNKKPTVARIADRTASQHLWGHVMPLVMWPFDSSYAISYWLVVLWNQDSLWWFPRYSTSNVMQWLTWSWSHF